MEEQFRAILKALGEDPEREGLRKTPTRCAKSLLELTRGYAEDPETIINGALFTEEYSEMIIMKDIDFFSLCEHHMLPIIGKAHIAYLPNERVVGISKLARIVDAYGKRLQIQEKLTAQIANTINNVLKPKGVAVVIEATHQCMSTRGVHKSGVIMKTSHMTGLFRSDTRTRQEFIELITAPNRTEMNI